MSNGILGGVHAYCARQSPWPRACAAFLAVAISFALGCDPLPGLPDDPPPTEIRVVTYNTHHFGDHSADFPDGKDAGEIVSDIVVLSQDLGIDVWLFQELYRSLDPNPNPYPTDHVARILEGISGFDYVFYQENDVDGRFSKGNGIFWDGNQFEAVGDTIRMNWVADAPWTDEKGGVAQILRRLADGTEFIASSLHFDAGIGIFARLAQGQEAVAAMEAGIQERAGLISVPPAELPWVFGGDLNTAGGRTEPVIHYLEDEAGLTPWIATTVKTEDLGFMLDHIHTLGLPFLGADVSYDSKGSDHYPVIVSIDLQ